MNFKSKIGVVILLLFFTIVLSWKYYDYSKVDFDDIRDVSELLVTRIISYEDSYYQRVESLRELLIDTSLVRQSCIRDILRKDEYKVLFDNKH